jgi:glycosyltransferase involved in cell wall biosynthesis
MVSQLAQKGSSGPSLRPVEHARLPAPRVAIAHDWIVRLGGSERCVLELLRAFPNARLLAAVVNRAVAEGALARAEASWLQRFPGVTSHHELFLAAMPLAWRFRRPVPDIDVVISSSHACAKAVRTMETVPHICYCHTPMRYAWSFDEERERFPRPLRTMTRMAMSGFRRWDRETASRVTQFVANSTAVAARIERAYGRRAIVVHPPVDTQFFEPALRDRSGFVYVGRLTGYKRPEVVVRAFAGLPHELTVVGDGPLQKRMREIATPNVRFARAVSPEQLREFYRTSIAMVFPANEDFGIAMAEAQACGTPVIGLAAGGALDIVEHGKTGWLVDRQDLSAVREAVIEAARTTLDSQYIAARSARFGADRFRQELIDIVRAVATGQRLDGHAS